MPPKRCILCNAMIAGCEHKRHLIACNEKLRRIEDQVIKSRKKGEWVPDKKPFALD